MSREIDRYVPQGPERKIQVIVATPSRTGTMSFLQAMEKLGYNPYHMFKAVMSPNGQDLRVMKEAIAAQRPHSSLMPYSRADYDKWFKSYDCLIEVPYLLDRGIFDAYRNDPEIKYVLVERDASRWADSVNGTAGWSLERLFGLEMSICKRFHAFLSNYTEAVPVVYARAAASTMPGDPSNKQAMINSFNEYIKMVKATVPAERLLVLKLEDGIAWQPVCEFLGKKAPEEPYPHGNTVAEFRVLLNGVLDQMVAEAKTRMLGVGVLATVGVCAAAWFRSTYAG